LLGAVPIRVFICRQILSSDVKNSGSVYDD